MKKLLSLLFLLLTTASLFAYSVKADTASGTTFEVTKAATPATVGTASSVSFAISIKNISSINTAPQQVTDTLPEGFTFSNDAKLTKLDATQVAFAPEISGQTLTWTFDGDTLQSIPQNENIVITYTTTSASTAGSYKNRGCLTQPENVCAEATVTVQTTTPQTGLIEDVFLASGIGAIIIMLGLLMRRKKRSFEDALLN